MKQKTFYPVTTDIIDDNLTPENAQANGYQFINDIINPYEAVRDIIEFAQEKGYKFGAPDKKINTKLHFGLYRPIKDK